MPWDAPYSWEAPIRKGKTQKREGGKDKPLVSLLARVAWRGACGNALWGDSEWGLRLWWAV